MAGHTISKASGLNNDLIGKSEAPIRSIIEHAVEEFEVNSMIDKVFFMDTTNKFGEKYSSLTSLGGFEDVGENGAYPLTSMQEGFSKFLEPSTWKDKFEITAEMYEDTNFKEAISGARNFALVYARTREMYAAAMIAGGIDSSITFGTNKMRKRKYDTTTADGLSLFNKAHKSVTNPKYTQSNRFSYTAASSDFEDVIDAVQENMQSFADDDGNLLAVAPDTIIIPNKGTMKRKLFSAINSEFKQEGDRSGFNFQYGGWNVIIWPYLPKLINGKEYFLMMDSKYNQNYMCLPWLDRLELNVKNYTNNDTDAEVWAGRARFIAGFNNWRSIAIAGDALSDATAL